jgi:hypothetical protein
MEDKIRETLDKNFNIDVKARLASEVDLFLCNILLANREGKKNLAYDWCDSKPEDFCDKFAQELVKLGFEFYKKEIHFIQNNEICTKKIYVFHWT